MGVRQRLAIRDGILGPRPYGFDGVAERFIGRAAPRCAAGEIGDGHPVSAGLTVDQCYTSCHCRGLLLSIAPAGGRSALRVTQESERRSPSVAMVFAERRANYFS
jgi:hypothetical protein